MTKEKALAMQDALIAVCSAPAFQKKLSVALLEAGSDPMRQARVRHELSLPVQTPVVRRFGFDSVADSIEAFTAELNADPEIAHRRRVLDALAGVREGAASGISQVMPSVMQVFAAVPSQHQSLFHSAPIGPQAALAEGGERPTALLRSFSHEGGRRVSSKSPVPRARLSRRHRSASKRAVRKYDMSRETAIAMQDALIEALERPELQRALRRELNLAGSDEAARMRARQTICVPVQQPIVRRFGFFDVAESLTAFSRELDADSEVAMRRARLDELVMNPTNDSDEHPAAYLVPSKRVELGPMPGQLWRVIGGKKLGGIVPRKGKELSSPLLGTRAHNTLLARGAVVQELELCAGERLHYRKVSGEGPEYGWVSLQSLSTGNQLVERVTERVMVLQGKTGCIESDASPNSDVIHVLREGEIVEVFKRAGLGNGEYCQLTPRELDSLSHAMQLSIPEAFVRFDEKFFCRLPGEERSDGEGNEPEVLCLSDGRAAATHSP